jgi:hypothetical protein
MLSPKSMRKIDGVPRTLWEFWRQKEGKQANKCKFTKWQWVCCKSAATATFQHLLLGVPTYLPTYNSSMLILSPKPSSSSFKISANHVCIDWTRITKRSSRHVQRPHKLYNRTAESKFGSENWDYQEAREYVASSWNHLVMEIKPARWCKFTGHILVWIGLIILLIIHLLHQAPY